MYWIENADSALLLPTLPTASVDALVTDPPAGIGFMGKEWDGSKGGRDKWIAWLAGILRECCRVLKPGAYGWVWAIPRTSHWTATACEDAGFVVRDVMTHVFGCLSEDAEILTIDGWKPYHQVGIYNLALCYSPSGHFDWLPIQKVHVYEHDQVALHISSNNTDHIVTSGHRVLVGDGNDWRIRVANELSEQAIIPILEDIPTAIQEASARMPVLSSSFSTKEQCGTQQSALLQPFLSSTLLLADKGYGSDRQQRESGVDERESSFLSGEDDGGQESRLARRRDAIQTSRCVQWREVRLMPQRIPDHGPEGRVCDGASHIGSSAAWQAPSQGRSGTPHQPRSQGQLSSEFDAFSVESKPQAFRGSRLAIADLARVQPIHYRGRVWCVEVPTGVFVARRNGKVFLTGNTGFPKSRSLLKPAAEHWILVKAPGELRELRIEENRIAGQYFTRDRKTEGGASIFGLGAGGGAFLPTEGRWPANFALSHSDDCADACVEDCPVRLLDEQAGPLKSGKMQAGTVRSSRQGVALGVMPAATKRDTHGDSGSASRFFYVAKASTKERSAGLPDRNSHPTVKSVALMRHLIRLIAAPGSLILDPFTGSGSTAVAALQEGCRFAGIEQDSQHAETARLRARHTYSNMQKEQPCPSTK